MTGPRITRLAPSPTGALHLGNARTFVINHLLAKQNGWKVTLRIDDLDGPRIKSGAADQAIDDLKWLGITWDTGPTRQSDRGDVYARAVDQLLRAGRAYACTCSRKEIDLAASAPHAEDGAAVYPGTCRGRYASPADALARTGRRAAIRFAVGAELIEFIDHFAGPQRFEPARQLGDFVIQKADGTAAYQLAVVLDDAAAGVTDVVRGDDLLDSTPRQLLIYRALGLAAAIPNYWHVPLVLGEDGRRLAKRHGDTRLSAYRSASVPAERMLALIGRWIGVPAGDAMSMDELVDRFDLRLPAREPIIFSPADDEFLRTGRRT